MEDSALKLIWASCSPQTFCNTINANMKDGKVVLAVQAELNDDMEDMMKSACWVDITKGMEMSVGVSMNTRPVVRPIFTTQAIRRC